MSGRLAVVGIGPGPQSWITPAATDAISAATHVLGYAKYIERLTPRPGQIFEATDNREELARAKRGLSLACDGAAPVLVSGGDPGVFAMAAAVFEAIDDGPAGWRALDVLVEPGVTAMLAAAARAGAPLGADFCAISLSDNLKPWALIERRLRLAADAGFAIALYNPASKSRPGGIHRAFDVLKSALPEATTLILAHDIGRSGERLEFATLATASASRIAMNTMVIVGTADTRVIAGPNGQSRWAYTPRSVAVDR